MSDKENPEKKALRSGKVYQQAPPKPKTKSESEREALEDKSGQAGASSLQDKEDKAGSHSETKERTPSIESIYESDSSSSLSESVAENSDSSSNSSVMSGPKFTLVLDNYDAWSVRIEALLRRKKLWIDLAAADAAIDADKASSAYFKIVEHVDDTNLRIIETDAKNNSVKALNLLKARYEGKGALSKIQLLNDCLTMKHDKGPLEPHIDAMRQKYQKLKHKGFAVPEILQISNLMISLNDSYGGVFTSFLQIDEAILKFEDIANALLTEQRRRSISGNELESAAAVNKVNSVNNKRKRMRCSFCNRFGHLRDVCYTLKRSQAGPSGFGERKNNSDSSRHSKFGNAVNLDNADCVLDEHLMYAHQSFSATYSNAKELAPAARKRAKQSISSDLRAAINERRAQPIDYCGQANSAIKFKPATRPLTPEKTKKLGSIVFKVENGLKQDVETEAVNDELEREIDCTSPAISILSQSAAENMFTDLNKTAEIYASVVSSEDQNALKLSGFLIDSGASIHVAHQKSLFSQLTLATKGRIRVANGSFVPILGHGSVIISVKTGSDSVSLTLKNVAYAPGLHVNLISVNELNKSGYTLLFENSKCLIKTGKQFIELGTFRNNNFLVSEDTTHNCYPCLHEMHKRLAHRNYRDIKHLQKFGLKLMKCCCIDQCDACIRGKSSEAPYKAETVVCNPLDVITSDLCGMFRTKSLGGASYFLTLTDVYTDYTTVKFLKQKSDATRHIKDFISFVKNQLSRNIKTLRTDGGGEYLNNELKTFLESEGIRHEYTTPNSPQSNGNAERKNRTILDAMRTLLIASGLPNYLWAEAISNLIYTQNRIVRRGQTSAPIERFFGHKARATFMEFGSSVYVNTSKLNRGKLDERASVMKFMCVDDHSKGFRVWDGHKIHISRNVKPKLNSKVLEYESPLLPQRLNRDEQNLQTQESDRNVLDASRNSKSSADISFPNDVATAPRRSKRLQEQQHNCASADDSSDIEPKTYKQAMSSPHSDMWLEAMQDEMNSLTNTGTYELTELPKDRKAIGCRWVYKLKTSEDGGMRYKARLVAKGYSQRYGEDFCECFSPVVRAPTIRLLLSMAGKLKFHVIQFDVKTAFLNGHLEEEIYMQQPEGFQRGNHVMRLRKSLYGLKQAARAWNTLLKSSLESVGLKQSEADDCLFTMKTSEGVLYLGAHVDDLIVVSSSLSMIDVMETKLAKAFELKNLGQIKQFLGVQIKRHDDGHFSINQEPYISKIARELKLEGCSPQKYPIDPGYYRLEDDNLIDDNTEFRKIIGMLLYLSTNSRPDISASVAILAQRVEHPRKLDLSEALRVIKYLIGTKDHELHLNNANAEQSLTVFSDANFGECRKDGKSNSGVICFVNGGTISWSSKKQSLVALSTCEAELQAVCEAVKEVIWLKRIISEFEDNPPVPTVVYNDNQSTINMISSGNLTQRTKYIGVRCHFIQDWIKRGQIDLRHCASEHNSADMFTKPLNSVKLVTMRRSAGLLRQGEQPSASNITLMNASIN